MTKQIIHSDLIAEIEAYAAVHMMTQSKAGEFLMGDPNLLRDLKNGRELRRSSETRVRDKLRQPPETA